MYLPLINGAAEGCFAVGFFILMSAAFGKDFSRISGFIRMNVNLRTWILVRRSYNGFEHQRDCYGSDSQRRIYHLSQYVNFSITYSLNPIKKNKTVPNLCQEGSRDLKRGNQEHWIHFLHSWSHHICFFLLSLSSRTNTCQISYVH